MISRKSIDNLIAQTNYLSTMFQTYHDLLKKQSHHSQDESKLTESQLDSIFESSESQKKSQSHHFLSNGNELHSISPYLNGSPYQSDIFENEIHDRPTGYMRDQDKKELKDKIQMVDKSIDICFQAVQSQLEIRKRLNQKGMLKYDWKGSPSGSAIKTKPSKKSFKKSGKGQTLFDKLKSK